MKTVTLTIRMPAEEKAIIQKKLKVLSAQKEQPIWQTLKEAILKLED